MAFLATRLDEDATARPTIPSHAIRVQIGAIPEGRPVAPGFLGLSIEYRSAPGYFGPARDPDTVFNQLVRNLTPGQSPVLRFGGDTTDWTWAPTAGVARPRGVRYTLGSGWMSSTRASELLGGVGSGGPHCQTRRAPLPSLVPKITEQCFGRMST